MAKLHGPPCDAGQLAEKRLQPVIIAPKVRWKLQEDRTETVLFNDGVQPFQHDLYRRQGTRTQPMHVSDLSVCLGREDKSGRRLVQPSTHHLLRRQAVPNPIELDSLEAACVVSKKLSRF